MGYVDLATLHTPIGGARPPANYGRQIEANFDFLATPPCCSVSNSAGDPIANDSEEVVLWDSESFDTALMHSTVSNTGRITAPVAGKYRFTAYVAIGASATGFRYAALKKNGTDYLIVVEENDPSASRPTRLNPSRLVQMSAGDYVEVAVFQNSGGSLDVEVGSAFDAEWVSL